MDVADDSQTEKKTSDLVSGDKPDNLAGLIDET
jgi:hypothetical protein